MEKCLSKGIYETESKVNHFYMAQWLRGLDSDLQIESQ